MSLLVRGLSILLAIGVVVLLYLLTIWILGMLGLSLPENILKVIFVCVGLAAAIAALTGRFDNWFPKG